MGGEVRLADIAVIIMGQSPPGKTYNENGEGIPFFQGVADFSYRHPTPRVYCTAPSRIAGPGDILLSVRAPIGRVNVANKSCAIGRGLSIIRPKDSKDCRYIEFTLRYLESHWHSIEGSGSVFGNATRNDLEILPIPWPAESKRRAIAHILGTLDDKIELNRRISETLEQMARAIFKSWFVDFDPVRAKMEGRWKRGRLLPGLPAHLYDLFPDRLVASEIGEIPEGWEVMRVGNALKAVGGGTPRTSEPHYWNGGKYCWATPKDLSGLEAPILLDTERKITEAGLSQISSGLLPEGTVLMSSRAPVGYLALSAVPIAINQGFIAMVCDGPVSNLYTLNWCHLKMDEIKQTASGTTFAEISKAAFRPILMLVPEKRVMQIFTEKAKPFYRNIQMKLEQSRTIATLRDTLLPKLISGELRVKDAGRFLRKRGL